MTKKSIKRLGIFLLIIGLAGFVGWKIFNRKLPVNNPVPNYAEAIICLDYVNIRNTLLSNYLFESTNDFKSPFLQEFQKSGLKIPNYIIAFSCSDENSTGLFTSFEIDDKALFQTYVDSLMEKDNYRKIDSTSFIFSSLKGRSFFSYDSNKSKVVISTGINLKEKFISKVFLDVLNEANLLSVDNQLLTQIKISSNHGLIWFGKGKRIEKESWLMINLDGDELKLEGDVFLKKEYQFEEENIITLGRVSQASFYLNGGNSLLIKELYDKMDRKKFKKLTNFSLDSLMKYSNNTFEFDLYGTEIQSDTSVQYEYDDDFNKVEKLEITQSVHPQFELNIPYQNNNLFHYLVDDSCIKQIDRMYIFTPYPFSKVHAAYGNGLSLFTSPNLQAQWLKFPTAISFIADFKEIDSNLLEQIGIRNSIFDNKSVSLIISQKSDSTQVDGRIEFK